MGNKEKNNLLSSWKEIATYLKCEVRTCQRWEKNQGLPVYRIDDSSSRSNVYAYKDEIDTWLKKKADPNFTHSRSPRIKPVFRKRKIYFLPLGLILLVFIILHPFKNRQPLDFRIDGSSLVIVNKRENTLWTFDTEVQNLCGEDRYRRHFQTKGIWINDRKETQRTLPYIKISDINNDNKKEILFAPFTPDNYGVGLFYCFNHRGKIKWTFPLGKKIKYGKEIFEDFTLIGFDTVDFNNDSYMEIIIFSHAVRRFPTQLCILDHNGQKTGEYWNSGVFTDFVFVDINEDGRKELIVSGMNNEYKKGCLVVFDPSNINGGSFQEKPYTKSEELNKGTEKYYILFPRTDIEIVNSWHGHIQIINFLNNGVIELQESRSFLLYQLNHNFEVINIVNSHRFQQLHAEAKRTGKISSVLNSEYIQNLLKSVLYWNGSTWINKPAMSNPWEIQ